MASGRLASADRPEGPSKKLPVACERHEDVAKALAALQAKPAQDTRSIHVLPTKGQHPPMVYIGAQGLKGGGNGAGEASGSDEPQDKPAASQQEARQALRAYYQQPAVAQVKSLFKGEAPKPRDTLACALMLEEQGQGQEPQATHKRRDRVKTPIALETQKHPARRERDSKGALGRRGRDWQDHAESQVGL